MLCLKAPAKINWTLDILGARPDGYHLMDMLMQTVAVYDTLWLEDADELTLASADIPNTSDEAPPDALASAAVVYDHTNLVYRAADALRVACGVRRGARMRLHKAIPSGAGMGGGSADAATALHGLNRLWGLGLSLGELCALGVKLGADIPFLLTGGLARVQGIGEAIQPLTPAPRVWLTLIQPCGGLSTREVFAAFDALDASSLSRPRTDAAQAALLAGDLRALGGSMENVLEAVSVAARPALADGLAALERAGAIRAMMTGSGSVLYGVFADEASARRARNEMLPFTDALGVAEPIVTHTLTSAEMLIEP